MESEFETSIINNFERFVILNQFLLSLDRTELKLKLIPPKRRGEYLKQL